MLPTPTDNGARLAAILPSGLAAVARGLGSDPDELLDLAFASSAGAVSAGAAPSAGAPAALPGLRSFVVVVADGLGQANLKARAGHARTLSSLPQKRIETVAPSTTGAALTTLTTGRLPGEHGLIGYRIMHPELGLVTTLKDWGGIRRPREWQRAEPLFALAERAGARAVAFGRPAHASGGLTEAILRGAEYVGGQRIEDRFADASRILRGPDPVFAYLYVDELDRAAHEHGWESETWLRRLEQLDAALEGFLRGLPGDVGVVVTADHGIVDVGATQQIMMDARPELLDRVAEIGGEPRLRSLYLRPGTDARAVAAAWEEAEGARAWVGTREDAIASGWFGPVHPEVAPRLGEVLVAARRQVAYYVGSDDPKSLDMVGQHGGFTSEERGIPLLLAGALAGTGFASAVASIARTRVPGALPAP
ncbi:alkaline phosphatase family protein [Leucobacter sp. CSA1]|uniref:Alkaline phosphatase family protein n=1 Tax=Leucobacter chromiisoli TaxID=2796471 RepID=A0A934UU58_9MICO|nr:alkaline phosphatase family protein [Leucobacter chromiisoli]MBK0418071.1 alkaline phosphatase family protein [Leucobacter chromiisoli]